MSKPKLSFEHELAKVVVEQSEFCGYPLIVTLSPDHDPQYIELERRKVIAKYDELRHINCGIFIHDYLINKKYIKYDLPGVQYGYLVEEEEDRAPDFKSKKKEIQMLKKCVKFVDKNWEKIALLSLGKWFWVWLECIKGKETVRVHYGSRRPDIIAVQSFGIINQRHVWLEDQV